MPPLDSFRRSLNLPPRSIASSLARPRLDGNPGEEDCNCPTLPTCASQQAVGYFRYNGRDATAAIIAAMTSTENIPIHASLIPELPIGPPNDLLIKDLGSVGHGRNTYGRRDDGRKLLAQQRDAIREVLVLTAGRARSPSGDSRRASAPRRALARRSGHRACSW